MAKGRSSSVLLPSSSAQRTSGSSTDPLPPHSTSARSAAPATEDDSLVVHPATQAQVSKSKLSGEGQVGEQGEEGVAETEEEGEAESEEEVEVEAVPAKEDSQGFWEAEEIVRFSHSVPPLPPPLFLRRRELMDRQLRRGEMQIDESGKKYLIKWKGTDEDGDPWKPTWVRPLFALPHHRPSH